MLGENSQNFLVQRLGWMQLALGLERPALLVFVG